MEIHGIIDGVVGMELDGTFPWNSIENVIILHGNWCPNPPCKYFLWKSMEKFPWNSMEIDVLILHGIPWRFFTRDAFSFSAARSWNELPKDIKEAQ